jgi:hypothetical protein
VPTTAGSPPEAPNPDTVMAAFIAIVANRTPATENGPLGYYAKAKPYLADGLYSELTSPTLRGDPAWSRWHDGGATLTGEVVRAGHPDGAPVDKPALVYRTTLWTPTVTWPDGRTETLPTERRTVTLALVDGRWVIDRFFNA